MKSFVRWSAVFGLVGSAVLGSSLLGAMKALALPQEQILQKLRSVPVFTIANNQGAPLVATPPASGQNRSTAPVAGVFITQKDAEAFLSNLKTRNPEVAKEVRVVPVALSEVYQLEQTNQNKPDRLDFAFVPNQQQVSLALNLLKQSGQQVQEFNGVPLFIARGGKEKGYLTIQRDNQQVIPVFFKKEELQSMLDRFKQQQPDLASSVEIQVVNLEGVLQTMKTSDNPALNQIVLVPPQESLDYIRSLQPAGGNQPRPAGNQPAQPRR